METDGARLGSVILIPLRLLRSFLLKLIVEMLDRFHSISRPSVNNVSIRFPCFERHVSTLNEK